MKNDYFKGWYFKCSNNDQTIALIPAFHISHGKKTASLQMITDNSVHCIQFPDLKYSKKPLCIQIGNCIFSEKGIQLNIQTNQLTVQGVLQFNEITPIQYDIMGPFQFVPFMQCRHSVYSMRHHINGKVTVNGQIFSFQNGIGYIEGDCGTSFPETYIWTQCHFNNTYLGAKVRYIGENTVTVQQGDFRITAKLLEKNAHPLSAPINGQMCRTIHESASCKAYYRFSYKDRILCEFTSERASFEFEYNSG